MFHDVRDGNIQRIRENLNLGVDINLKDDHGFTALHVACISGKIDIAILLLSVRAEVNVKDKSGSTPLHKACINGYTEIVSTLLSHGAQINGTDDNRSTPLHHACIYGHISVVSLLLGEGAKVDIQDNFGQSPLHYGSMKGVVEIVTLLLSHQARVDLQDYHDFVTPLHNCCHFGHSSVATLLLDQGAPINAVDKNGDTPLHSCCQSGHSDILSLLLQRGAKFNLKNKRGKTALDIARQGGFSECISILREAQRDKDSKESENIQNQTLELQALRSENEYLKKELLVIKEKSDWREKEIIKELKKRNQEVQNLKSQLSKFLSPDLERKCSSEESCQCQLGGRLFEMERKIEELISLKEEKEMHLNEKETRLLECQMAVKDLKTLLNSKDGLMASHGGLDLTLYRDLHELKLLLLLNPKRHQQQALPSSLLHPPPPLPSHSHSLPPHSSSHSVDEIKQFSDPLKIFDSSGRDISKLSFTLDNSHLSEELTCKVKELMIRLEARERELILKNESDNLKLCQLSKKSFMNYVEAFGGGFVWNRKEASHSPLLPSSISQLSSPDTLIISSSLSARETHPHPHAHSHAPVVSGLVALAGSGGGGSGVVGGGSVVSKGG